MKKFLTMLLVVAMALSITACAAEKKEKKAGHKSAYKSPYNTGGVK